jgi:glycosyltransferase involved in cell wall biosynthesis
MEKLLTIAIPSYNVGWCLDKCLSSFLTEPLSDKLEIIIVNDGSTDNGETLNIASVYVEKYPSVFSLIDKPNGGHGSTINAAIKQANGKYFKSIDADDWVITGNLAAFLDVLAETEADAIITHFHTVDMKSGKKIEYKTRDIKLDKLYTTGEYTSMPGEIYHCTVYHGLTFRTEIYRESGAFLSEGIFYEDQEYATMPFTKVQTILPLDIFLYQYLTGNANQSVADINQVKRLGHVEQVVKKLFECHTQNPNIPGGNRRYIARKAKELFLYYCAIAMVKNPDKKNGRREAERFRLELRETEPDLIASADKTYKLIKFMSRLGFTGNMLKFIKKPLPFVLFRKLFKKNK